MRASFKKCMLFGLVVLGLCAASIADTFTFTATGTDGLGNTVVLSGSGVGNPIIPGQTLATSLTGVATFSGGVNQTDTISLIPGGPSATPTPTHHWIYNNVVYGSDPFLDIYGLGLNVSSFEANLFYDPVIADFGTNYVFGITGLTGTGPRGPRSDIFALNDFHMEVSETPEPASLMLLSSGLVGLTGTARKRMRR